MAFKCATTASTAQLVIWIGLVILDLIMCTAREPTKKNTLSLKLRDNPTDQVAVYLQCFISGNLGVFSFVYGIQTAIKIVI
jgi:hypothetical protein